jgi:hypothetical protein
MDEIARKKSLKLGRNHQLWTKCVYIWLQYVISFLCGFITPMIVAVWAFLKTWGKKRVHPNFEELTFVAYDQLLQLTHMY